ncbi:MULTISPECIES: DUF2017 domain-containing protein [Arthrobacter]|uniref:DUF2017 domain-containing protein n=2 Tax=Arthrobacter TaxID=1663 RepID=A0ABU9KQS8_9MICC|nr:DUF2017 domain-containing protein [Arthrobacter sp. YJM1]MDP5228367.1 DUF2017 domain-containing protein [Arthrobacter sp. YJM1]
MARTFVPGSRGISGHLEEEERDLLRKVFGDVIQMLEPEARESEDPLVALTGIDPHAAPPRDAALRRLLPDGVKDGDEAALEFRRLTERSLRESKIGSLRAASLLLEGSELQLNSEEARHLAMALNDVRLVVSERLEIRTEADAEAVHAMHDWSKADDLEEYLSVLYNFVTWLQESLVQAMAYELDRTPDAAGEGEPS